MNVQRLKKIQTKLINSLLIKKKENLRYLAGHSFEHTEGYLLIKKNNVIFFGTGLEKIEGIKKTDSLRNIGKYLLPTEPLEIYGEFTYAEGRYIKSKLNKSKLKITVAHDPVDIMRQKKDEIELALIRHSMEIVGEVFGRVKKQLVKKQWTEVGLAKFITETGFALGAEDVSFPAIVASGSNAAIPHHIPNEKKLIPNESIIIDFGFKYKGYCSDFTRTVFLKSAPPKLAAAYSQTELAYVKSFEASRTGVAAQKIFDISMNALEQKNLGKYFIHSLGHGTGLEIHELPNLSPLSKDIMSDGMVFSIEPGVYFPKVGGIRIEDLMYIEKGVCKKFIIIPTDLKNNIII